MKSSLTICASYYLSEELHDTLLAFRTLAAQLYGEFKEFFPNNAVE